jgi:hypothetical protein
MRNTNTKTLLFLCLSLIGITLVTKTSDNTTFKVVTANINLMPKSLNIATTGKSKDRAIEIVKALIDQHPNTDVYVIQEMYDTPSSTTFVEGLEQKGFTFYPGPAKEVLASHWKKNNYFVLGSAKNSGQGIFIRNDIGLKVESYDILSFIDKGIEGIGVLETYVPKGVIHIRLSRKDGNQSISIFGHHLQAEVGLFALSHLMRGKLLQCMQAIASDIIHFQPSQRLRARFPNYLEAIRKRQIAATMNWIKELKKENKVSPQILHIGDFNLIAGTPEYRQLLKTMHVVPVTDRTDLVTIGHPENTTWGRWTRPTYQALCKYLNNYGWMDLALVTPNLKNKVANVRVIDLKNEKNKSVTDHASLAVTFSDVFNNE